MTQSTKHKITFKKIFDKDYGVYLDSKKVGEIKKYDFYPRFKWKIEDIKGITQIWRNCDCFTLTVAKQACHELFNQAELSVSMKNG